MFKSTKRKLCINLLILSCLAPISPISNAGQGDSSSMVSPIRLDRDIISGIGLDTVSWVDKSRSAKWSHIFTGKELSVSVFESTPISSTSNNKVLKPFLTSYPYDQFVLVLSGKSVLTDTAGNKYTFSQGDSFVVPKGFSGTWEEHGVYRELIVILEEAVRTRELDIEMIEVE